MITWQLFGALARGDIAPVVPGLWVWGRNGDDIFSKNQMSETPVVVLQCSPAFVLNSHLLLFWSLFGSEEEESTPKRAFSSGFI